MKTSYVTVKTVEDQKLSLKTRRTVNQLETLEAKESKIRAGKDRLKKDEDGII